MQLKCDVCGVNLGSQNIGLVIHPHSGNMTCRCNKCHKSSGGREKKSSYTLLD